MMWLWPKIVSDPKQGLFESPRSDIRYSRPAQPLQLACVDHQSGLGIDSDIIYTLLSMARWETNPPYHEGGRSAWVRLREPLISTDASQTPIAAFKIKGAGFLDKNMACPPRTDTYYDGKRLWQSDIGVYQVLIHQGVADDGSFVPVLDPPRPTGGMSFERAQSEFNNARLLWLKGVSAILPVAYGQYPDLLWQGKPMGFVILGNTLGTPQRMGDYYESVWDPRTYKPTPNALLQKLTERLFHIAEARQSPVDWMRAICHLAEASGEAMRQFHDAGLCRFAGHSGNFQYNPATQQVIIHDIDSSVVISSLPEKARGLSLVRDIQSALFGLQNSVLHSGLARLCRPDDLGENNPLMAWLIGYFRKDLDEGTIRPADYRQAGRDLLVQFRSDMESMPFHDPMATAQWIHDMSFRFIDKATALVMGPFAVSRLGEEYPFPYDQTEVVRHLQKFRIDSYRLHQEELGRRIQRFGPPPGMPF